MIEDNINPFSVRTAEGLTPQEVYDLFVDHAAYHKMTAPGHTLIQGPRGSGKSMLFRYMSPACQCIARVKSISEIPFVAVVLQSKRANVQLPELKRISKTGRRLLIENLLVTMIASQVCDALLEVCSYPKCRDKYLDIWVEKLYEIVVDAVSKAGYQLEDILEDKPPLEARLNYAKSCLQAVEQTAQDYLAEQAFDPSPKGYSRKFLNYQFFLLPLFRALHEYSGLSNQTFFVLIDDGDWFTDEQIKVINSWLSFRTTEAISFKITHQLDYKTYETTGSKRIESPHDFNRIDLGTIYTHGVYHKWVKGIVEKRLSSSAFKITKTAEEFFPYDDKQAAKLMEIRTEISSEDWDGPKTARHNDDMYRYARPELIRRLGGVSKQRSKFLYCGFDQLVDISNATIRYFLEAASEMYAEEQVRVNEPLLLEISPKTQNDIVRKQADHLMHANFVESIQNLVPDEASNAQLSRTLKRVKNLVNVMGAAFFASLVSKVRSERRVLSFALQSEPDDEVMNVLRLAVGLNFFTESSIGRKEGDGRARRYVLNRLIAPYFNLDPSGFSGYLWVTGDLLKDATNEPAKAKDMLRKRLPSISEGAQSNLFAGFSPEFIRYIEAENEEN